MRWKLCTIYYIGVNSKELVSTGYGEYLGNNQESNFSNLYSNSSPEIPRHVLGKSLPTLLARPAYLNELKCLTSILRGWKPSSDFGSILWLVLSWKKLYHIHSSKWISQCPVIDGSWLRSSNKAFKASCGLPSKSRWAWWQGSKCKKLCCWSH